MTKREAPASPETSSPSERGTKIPVALPQMLTSNPWFLVPVMAAFLAMYWVHLVRPDEYGWIVVSWPLSTASLSLAVVAVGRRRYDGWTFDGGRVEVVRDRLVRTYHREDMESVKFRKLFTGLASVASPSGSPEARVFSRCQHVEVTARMKNGDRTSILLSAGDPAVDRVSLWCQPPSPAPLG